LPPRRIGVYGGRWFGIKKVHPQDVGANSGADTLRFVIILILIALAALVGLFVYGEMLEPETRTITQEAENAE